MNLPPSKTRLAAAGAVAVSMPLSIFNIHHVVHAPSRPAVPALRRWARNHDQYRNRADQVR